MDVSFSPRPAIDVSVLSISDSILNDGLPCLMLLGLSPKVLLNYSGDIMDSDFFCDEGYFSIV